MENHKDAGFGKIPYVISNSICNSVLETEVIDTGIGIDEYRQEFLFKPFSELKKSQDLKLVKDCNIGMGLACSSSIVKKLGGDITLKESKRGRSIFAFKIPIKC